MNLNKEELKIAVKEVLLEDPDFLKEIVVAVIKEKSQKENMDSKFLEALDSVFKEHKETFIKLA